MSHRRKILVHRWARPDDDLSLPRSMPTVSELEAAGFRRMGSDPHFGSVAMMKEERPQCSGSITWVLKVLRRLLLLS